MRLREPHGLGDLRAGRFVVATGAIRPVQIDGLSVIARAPMGANVESSAGSPVVPSFGARAYDWIAGGRVSQKIASRMTIGASYVERRAHGEIADDEFGADLAAAPLPLARSRCAQCLRSHEPRASPTPSFRLPRAPPTWRFELFGSHRSPSRLLPATSLFSVLGDFPSDMIGSTVRWQAAPRLDLHGDGSRAAVGAELGGNAWLRALLRLNERGRSKSGHGSAPSRRVHCALDGLSRDQHAAARSRISSLVRDRDRLRRCPARSWCRLAVGPDGTRLALAEHGLGSGGRARSVRRRRSIATRPTRSCGCRTPWCSDEHPQRRVDESPPHDR